MWEALVKAFDDAIHDSIKRFVATAIFILLSIPFTVYGVLVLTGTKDNADRIIDIYTKRFEDEISEQTLSLEMENDRLELVLEDIEKSAYELELLKKKLDEYNIRIQTIEDVVYYHVKKGD